MKLVLAILLATTGCNNIIVKESPKKVYYTAPELEASFHLGFSIKVKPPVPIPPPNPTQAGEEHGNCISRLPIPSKQIIKVRGKEQLRKPAKGD